MVGALLGLVVAAIALWPRAGDALPNLLASRPRTLGGTPGTPGTRGHRVGGSVLVADTPLVRDGPAAGGSLGASDDHPREGRSVRPSPATRWRRRARGVALETALSELVPAIAAPLRAGVAPSVALVAVEPTCRDDPALGPLLRDLVEAARSGGSLAEAWLHHADLHQSADLGFVGQAWALSECTGAPLADALASGEDVLRARATGRQRLAGAAAGPRASMAVLCLLPASGPVVGAALGVSPRSLYFSSPLATASLVLGVVLGLGAWWWSRRILRRAA